MKTTAWVASFLLVFAAAGCSDEAGVTPAEPTSESAEQRLVRGTEHLKAKRYDDAIDALLPFMQPGHTGVVAARALCRLTIALDRVGRTAEAAQAGMRAQRIGVPPGEVDLAPILRRADVVLSLEGRLAEVAADPGTVTDAKEARGLATVAYSRKQYLTAAAMMERAFDLDPLREDMQGMRLLAARAAARVAADAAVATSVRMRWAQVSHDWMRDELLALREGLSAGRIHARACGAVLASWAANPELGLLREGGGAWPVLADDSRRAWAALWREMTAFADEIR